MHGGENQKMRSSCGDGLSSDVVGEITLATGLRRQAWPAEARTLLRSHGFLRHATSLMLCSNISQEDSKQDKASPTCVAFDPGKDPGDACPDPGIGSISTPIAPGCCAVQHVSALVLKAISNSVLSPLHITEECVALPGTVTLAHHYLRDGVCVLVISLCRARISVLRHSCADTYSCAVIQYTLCNLL